MSNDETLHLNGCTLPGDHEGACNGSQFPRPRMQEIGVAETLAGLQRPRQVVSICKRGHRSYGHPNYCGTCGTKFFRCWNCGEPVTFEAQHACYAHLPSERFHSLRWRWRYYVGWRLIGRKGPL